MSLVPGFEIGLWNAWILILPQTVILIVGDVILKRRETYESREELARHTKGEKKVSKIESLVFLLIVLYGIFLPLKVGIACASWILLLCGMVFLVLMHIWIPSEEHWCLERYGNAYREYINKTPKWIGLPKPGKE